VCRVSPGALLRRILPASVIAVQACGEPEDAPLFPEEAAHISRAVERRRREYATVRRCARQALEQLGQPPGPILSGPHREPLWPPGVVGSMTHCASYQAAALALSSEIATIGIDAEPNEPLPDGVLSVITLDAERTQLAELAALEPSIRWDRLLFCAKESVYKAWFPLTGTWLGFEQASITIDPMAQRFSARLLVPGPKLDGVPLAGFDGRWLAEQGLLITAIAVPQSRS
jgi:4'-phosphopantetheinyl transferase EntD